MLINHPVLNRLSPSVREVEPQTGDDTLVIPNRFSLTGLPPEPLFIAGTSTSTQESSFATGTSGTITNAVGASFPLCTLRNGWWSIRISGAYSANYVSILQGGDFQVNLSGPTQIAQILTRYAAVGAQSFETEFKIMIQQNHAIAFFLNNNGVGNSHQASCHVVCNKLL